MKALVAAQTAFEQPSSDGSIDQERLLHVKTTIYNLENAEKFEGCWFYDNVVVPALADLEQYKIVLQSPDHPNAAMAFEAHRVFCALSSPVLLLLQLVPEHYYWKNIMQNVPTSEEAQTAIQQRCSRLLERIRQKAEEFVQLAKDGVSNDDKNKFVEDAVKATTYHTIHMLIFSFLNRLPESGDEDD